MKKSYRTALSAGLIVNAGALLALTALPSAAEAVTEVESQEVVVSATKTEKPLQEVPSTVTLVKAEDEADYGYTSIADMVQDVPGVEIFDNSVAGGKRLMIRGETGERVLILVDGQKINEQKSMSGAPLLVDPATVERIEVVKGAGSVLYGSEAIGGVVNIITKKGGSKPIGGSISTTYSSGTEGFLGSLSLDGSSSGFKYRLTGTYSDQGDRRTPDGTLKGSDSKMHNVSAFLGYGTEQVESGLTLERYRLEADVPATTVMGSLFDLNLPEWSREKAGVFVDVKDLSDFLVKVHVDGYAQKTTKEFEQYMDINMGTMTVGSNINTWNEQKTWALNSQVDMAPGEAHYLIGGLAFSYDTLDATTDSSYTPAMFPGSSYYDDANITTWALYLQDEWNFAEDFTLTYGVRETWVESELEETTNPNASSGSVSDSHPAFSAGLTWNGVENLTLRGLFSQGYRFPDLNKLFIGTSHGGAITLANPDLDPETSNNFELGARFDNSHLKTDFSLFYNKAEDYISTRTIAAGYNQYQNVDEANTWGMEAWVGYRFEPASLTPYINGTIIRRQYEEETFSTWKTNTPLFSGRVGVRFEQPMASLPMKLRGDLYLRAADEAKEESASGSITTNDSWQTLNFSLGTGWGKDESWQASLNFNNIFDTSYTTAQNSLEEEGFNVVARLAYRF